MEARTNGWWRLAVILTIGWLLSVGGLFAWEYWSLNPFCAFPGGDWSVCSHFFFRWVPTINSGGEVEGHVVFQETRLFLVWLLIPIVALWFIISGAVYVLAGFRR